jgi:hypothetical protein
VDADALMKRIWAGSAAVAEARRQLPSAACCTEQRRFGNLYRLMESPR